MPVVAVAVAVGASVAAGSAVAATVGGIMAISAVTAFEVVGAVGAVIGAVGAVTRNKTLSMVGMGIGAVGAIGGLAAGAGLLGEAAGSNAPLFGAAPTASTADEAAAGTVDFVAGDASASGLIDVPPAPPGGVGTVDAAGNVVSEVAVPTGAEMAAEDASALGKTWSGAADSGTNTAGLELGDKVPTGEANPATPEPEGSFWGTSGMSKDAAAMAKSLPDGQQGPVLSSAAVEGEGSSGASGIFGKIMNFTDKHPTMSAGVIKGGMELVSGWTSELTPAQIAALDAKAAESNAATAMAKQQQQNLAMPKAVASSAPITGTPGPIVPPGQPGFMNNAPRITGAPA